MNFHAQKQVATFRPDGTAANFTLNGLPPKPGAPFADPRRDDAGNAVGRPRLYKGAAIQLDLKLNKAGWHFPQSRILTLWGDVAPTLSGTRAPEPLFFRANTNDCITFQHTNLTPHIYELDDFQVRTPTDIMGQHIHLVKFDVTSSTARVTVSTTKTARSRPVKFSSASMPSTPVAVCRLSTARRGASSKPRRTRSSARSAHRQPCSAGSPIRR